MNAHEHARLWWQRTTGEEETPFDGDAPAWVLSLVVHVAVLLALAGLVIPATPPAVPPIAILQTPAEPAAPDIVEFPPAEELIVGDEADAAGSQSAGGAAMAHAVASFVAEVPEAPVQAVELLESGDVAVDPWTEVSLPQGLDYTDGVAIRGDVAVGTTGAAGAVDRLTAEIRASLEQSPTLVVWVFDQSVSLAAQRRDIAARLDRVVAELGGDDAPAHGTDLFHMVYAYGRHVNAVVPSPTRSGAAVVRAVESIPVDESGEEMTFTALARAAKAAQAARIDSAKRAVMIVAFTDEVGNDEQDADKVAAVCRAQGIRVYVVGVPAPFGRRQVEVRFVEFDPRFEQTDRDAVVDQGPETLHPEVVRLGGGTLADAALDSGFGPYSLSKVCAETGGIYFCVHADRRTGGRVSATAPMASRLAYFFDQEVMRAYRPDYLPAARVERAIAANGAKRALVAAARAAAVDVMAEPRMIFPRENDGALAQLLGEAQRAAALVAPRIDGLYATLVAGERDRARLGPDEKRWQAGYDLALGRVLAAKVRTDAYNILLAQAKSGMAFADPRNDTWRLVPSDEVTNAGSQMERLASQARTYLERVVREHPGTPWALIAEDELGRKLGYEWREMFTGVVARKQAMAAGGGNRPPPDDRMRSLAPPKPPRPLTNL